VWSHFAVVLSPFRERTTSDWGKRKNSALRLTLAPGATTNETMRKNQDLLLAMMEEIGGPLMREAFKQEVLPHLRRSANHKFDVPITEEEY